MQESSNSQIHTTGGNISVEYKDANTGILSTISQMVSVISESITRLVRKTATPDDILSSYPKRTISIATPDKPNSPDSLANATALVTGYDRISVYFNYQRMANWVWVTNDGGDTLYVISTHNSVNWSGETPIYPGESRQFSYVFELRVRSPSASTVYRVSEYKPEGVLAANLSSFTAQVINAPIIGTLLPDIEIPTGMTLVIRANVVNTGRVYLANSIANSVDPAVPGNRITLNAGDVTRLYVTNADLVAVSGSAAGQNIDILVEQRN